MSEIIDSPVVRTVVAAGGVTTALVAIAVFMRRGWLWLAEVVQMQLAAGRIIHAELTRNGGSTLLDKVSRIPAIEAKLDSNIEDAERQFKTLGNETHEIKTSLQDINRRVLAVEERE